MIPKQEILSIAKAVGLRPDTVEKDYVLSWVLYGIFKNSHLSKWIFKGGTCLKKCYFETYRFSEDLDFTVPKSALYDGDGIKSALIEIATLLYEETGIEIKKDGIEVSESFNKKESKTYTAKIGYIGPLNYTALRSLPRIKFDITDDEILADESDLRDVFHPYSDAPNPPAKILCYSIHEILAEKTRALYERQGRARDLYDVIHIARTYREHVNIQKAQACLKQKFAFKSLPDPSVQLLMESIDLAILKANWENQLSHQLPILVAVETFYNDLPSELSWWIEEIEAMPILSAIQIGAGENTLPKDYFPNIQELQARSLGIGRKVQVLSSNTLSAGYLYQVRYAARNRLCVSIEYNGVTRIVEPYSLRRPRTGNLLLYAFELIRDGYSSNQIKAFNVPLITKVEITHEVFVPRFIIEL